MDRRTTASLLATAILAAGTAACGSSSSTTKELRDLQGQVSDLSQQLSELDPNLSEVDLRLSNLDSDVSEQAQSIDDLEGRLESQERAAVPQRLVTVATEISALATLYTELSESLSAVPRDKWLAQRLQVTQASTSNLAELLDGEDIIEQAISEFGLPLDPEFSTSELRADLKKAANSLKIVSDDLEDGLVYEARSGSAVSWFACSAVTANNAELCTYLPIESISRSLEAPPISERAQVLVVLQTHTLLNKVSHAFDAVLN